MKNGLHIDEAGTKRWYLDDKRHRQDGPAEIWDDGAEFWFLHDKLHRQDGPAVVYPGRSEYWHIHGNYLGKGVEGFWAHWALLTNNQRNNLNLHKWLAKYT